MLQDCKELCRRYLQCVWRIDSHVFEYLHCGGSGCSLLCRLWSNKQAPAQYSQLALYHQPTWSSTLLWLQERKLPTVVPNLPSKKSDHAKTKGCSNTVWQIQVHIFTCRFLRAILFKNPIKGVGLQPAVPSQSSALPSISSPFWS